MIFSNFSKPTLIAYLKYYDLLIPKCEEGSSKNNIIEFRKQCVKELNKQENGQPKN